MIYYKYIIYLDRFQKIEWLDKHITVDIQLENFI
jgi:hypothetical protein